MASAQIPTTPICNESENVLEIFCQYFVDFYEIKLEAYIKFIEGNADKPGKFADSYSEGLGQAIGGGIGLLISPLLIQTGAKAGAFIAKKFGKKIGQHFHEDKVESVFHLLRYWRNDKPGFRVKLIEAALDLCQSFEMQFMFIKAKGGNRGALRLVAVDSVNRSFNRYETIERSIEEMTISESVLQGNSKIERLFGMPVDKFIQTPGFTIYYKENIEWHTSSLFEKSGVIVDTDKPATYYKPKKNSKTPKYKYRRLLKYEIAEMSKLYEKYERETVQPKTNHLTDYKYKFSLDSKELCDMQKYLLDYVNENDPKLLEKRMKEQLTEIESVLHEIKTSIDAQNIDHNSLVEIKEFFTGLSFDIKRNFVEILEKVSDANISQHEETREMVAIVGKKVDQLINPVSKPVLTIKYKVRDCNLNYIKRYNANGVCKTDEINAHFYHNIVSSNNSKIPIPIVIISGLSGVGKSEEARKYPEFWFDGNEEIDRAVLWIDCTTFTSFIDTFKSIGFEYKIWTNVPETDEKIVDAIYSFFFDRETLFVFDNADEHVQKFLPQIVTLPLHEGQKLPYMLMTSRTKIWDDEGIVKFQLVELGAFTEQEGLNYVKDCLGLSQEETANDKDILDLYKLFSLPLALRQALAFIKAEEVAVGQCTITKCITEYNTNGKKLLNFLPYKNDEKRYSHSVLTTWLITLDKIKTQPGGKAAQEILNILAYLYPNAIDLYKILDISSEDDKNRDLKAGIKLLSKYSLIDLGLDNLVDVHALVQEVIRIQLRKVSFVWLGALFLLSFSLLLIIVNCFFSFHSELSWQLPLTVGFISLLYVGLNSRNTEEPTISKVLYLLRSERVYQDNDVALHARAAWYHGTNYFQLVFTHYFKNNILINFHYEIWSIQRYGPLHDTPLHLLCFADTESVYKLLWYLSFLKTIPKFFRKGVYIDAENGLGRTPLLLAVILDKLDTAKFLIEKGAKIEARNTRGYSTLHFAACNGNLDLAKLLIEKGVHVNGTNGIGRTPLYSTVDLDKLDMAKFLIENGASIEAKDVNENTPLHYAASADRVEMVKHFLEKGAYIDAKNGLGHTPLLNAIIFDKLDTAKFLIERSANIDAEDINGYRPLHYTAFNDNLHLTKLLIEKGAYVEAKNVHGRTPLYYTAHSDKLETAKFLIEKGASIKAKDVEEHTTLHYAAELGTVEMVKLFLEKRADIEAKNVQGLTPLLHALHFKKEDVAKFLIEKGASIEAKDANENTPLHYAVRLDELDMAKFLIEKGASVKTKDVILKLKI